MNWYVWCSYNPVMKDPLHFKYTTVFLNVKGGKHGNPPDMATIFFETRKKDNKLIEPKTNQKYVCSFKNFILHIIT